MDLGIRFQAYADDFERSYSDRNWLRLEPYFADDAVYECLSPPELAFRVEGRSAIIARFKEMTDAFDRTFASRTMRLDPPCRSGQRVTTSGVVVYAAPGAPPFELSFTEVADFRGAEIVRLEDATAPETAHRIGEWLALYGDLLKR